jgi:16S rRNA (adenine1518-N6/adenine1519-N6)-dimethyltransferase
LKNTNKSYRHKKKYGQHFLKSQDTAAQIASFLEADQSFQSVLEIGPGEGILTVHLSDHKHLYLSEIDPDVIALLRKNHPSLKAEVKMGDFLKLDLNEIRPSPIAIIGNFPYNISSQIVFKILENRALIPIVVGMFQSEMADRLAASPHSKDYGVITVLNSLYYEVERLMDIPPGAFVPPPKVNSAVIRMKRKAVEEEVNERQFRMVVKSAFSQRRKKISNAMKSMPGATQALLSLNLADKRAEDLSLQDFIMLTNQIEQLA